MRCGQIQPRIGALVSHRLANKLEAPGFHLRRRRRWESMIHRRFSVAVGVDTSRFEANGSFRRRLQARADHCIAASTSPRAALRLYSRALIKLENCDENLLPRRTYPWHARYFSGCLIRCYCTRSLWLNLCAWNGLPRSEGIHVGSRKLVGTTTSLVAGGATFVTDQINTDRHKPHSTHQFSTDSPLNRNALSSKFRGISAWRLVLLWHGCGCSVTLRCLVLWLLGHVAATRLLRHKRDLCHQKLCGPSLGPKFEDVCEPPLNTISHLQGTSLSRALRLFRSCCRHGFNRRPHIGGIGHGRSCLARLPTIALSEHEADVGTSLSNPTACY